MSRITRRDFMKQTTVGAAGLALAGNEAFAGVPAVRKKTVPNLLFIHTDQQHFQALSAFGNTHLHTPNMDRLAKRGVSFSQSYSANPVCCPARACWYTGRTSSENGMLSNDHRLSPDMPDLGQWFGTRGYRPFYSGKWHIPGRDPNGGFTVLTANPSGLGEHTDPVISRTAQSFLADYSGDKPFFLSLGFLQPHDCCYWVFAHPEDTQDFPGGLTERDLPPLPDNFECIIDEPPTMRKHMDGLRAGEEKWSPLLWRYYIWCYYRMVEMADAEIGRVLDALEDSRFADNTLIVFTSDHGDGLSRRRMVQKWWLYDEAVRVPLVIVPPGRASAGGRDEVHPVNGLDIAPTLCDYAGIDPPPLHRGRSLRPLVEGKPDWPREFIVSEAGITGRMVRTSDDKLITYKGEAPDLLFDMRRDPWEMTNLAGEAKHADTPAALKARLDGWERQLGVSSS